VAKSKNGGGRAGNGRFLPGSAGGPGRGGKRRTARTDVQQASLVSALVGLQDGWQNSFTGVGDLQRDKRLQTSHSADIVTAPQAADLWRGNALAARIIETWPNEMTREGWDVVVDRSAEEGLAGEVEARLEELGVAETLWRGLAYERAYGGAAILLGAKDGRALDQPLGRVVSLDWLTVFEPEDAQAVYWYADPKKDPKFGDPSHYQITARALGSSKTGASPSDSFVVHESRLIVFPGVRVSRRYHLTPNGWGDSIMTRVYRVLTDHGMGFDSAAVLMHDFAQAVFKIKNLADAVAEDRDDEIRVRTAAVELSRSVARAIIIDAEEEFERKQTPVTGLPELLDRFSSLLAAAADMPLTLLMGTSPGGLNATGESDIRFFYDRVRSAQQRRLKPHLERIVRLIFSALKKKEPDQWCVKFRPLWQESSKDAAEARKLQAETDQIYIDAMVVSPADIARSRFSGDGDSFATTVDFAERDKLEAEAKEAEKLVMEQSIMSAQAARGGETTGAKKPAKPAAEG
jgi:phage-related protein (TIGR01555 family)